VLRLTRRRLAAFVPTIVLVSILVFLLRALVPGGPAEVLLGADPRAQPIADKNKRLGLDHPVVVQYLNWIGGIFHGSFGNSYVSGTSVATIISQGLAATAELVIGALLVATIVGGVAGIFAAVKQSNPAGRAVLSLSALGLSVPDFWLATIAAGVFGLVLKVVPAVGYTPISAGLFSNLRSVILPILILSIPTGALITRHVQGVMSSALQAPYVRAAWAMGLPARDVYLKCALRAAVGPVITFRPLALAGLVGASVIVESIFNIPGLGSDIVTAATGRDYPVMQAIILILAVLVIVLNAAADLVVAIVDPRVRRGL
jgi:peptide/nickel transport system permease protein